jgi:ankyrin repeat protein
VFFEAGNEDLVKMLIGAGAEVDVTDRKCQTPLYSAVFNLHLSTALLLLEKGAHPEGSPKHLDTPLQIAIMHKNVAILQVHNKAIHLFHISNSQLKMKCNFTNL